MRIKMGVAACAVALGATAATTAGSGVAAAAPYAYTPQISVNILEPCRGQLLEVELREFTANALVHGTLASDPIDVFDVRVNAAGYGGTRFRVPHDISLGEHLLIATDAAGDRATVEIHVHICEREHAEHRELPRTGAGVAGVALLGGILIAGGTALADRRRRR